MKSYIKYFLILIISLPFINCKGDELWEIKKIQFNDEAVYLKSYTYGFVIDRNKTMLSKTPDEVYDSITDCDLGDHIEIIYNVENDSLYIYRSEGWQEYDQKHIAKYKFYNTKLLYLDGGTYIKCMDSLDLNCFGSCTYRTQ